MDSSIGSFQPYLCNESTENQFGDFLKLFSTVPSTSSLPILPNSPYPPLTNTNIPFGHIYLAPSTSTFSPNLSGIYPSPSNYLPSEPPGFYDSSFVGRLASNIKKNIIQKHEWKLNLFKFKIIYLKVNLIIHRLESIDETELRLQILNYKLWKELSRKLNIRI